MQAAACIQFSFRLPFPRVLKPMLVECLVSNLGSDVRCLVCGQGFLLFADRCVHRQRARFRHVVPAVQQVLRLHHVAGPHPTQRFFISLFQDLVPAA